VLTSTITDSRGSETLYTFSAYLTSGNKDKLNSVIQEYVHYRPMYSSVMDFALHRSQDLVLLWW